MEYINSEDALADTHDWIRFASPRPSKNMSEEFTLWRSRLKDAIGHLSSIVPAAKRKADSKHPGFDEAMSRLYIEAEFNDFLSYQAWRQAGLNKHAGKELDLLKQRLDAYDEPETDAEILNDPSWKLIVAQAHRVLLTLQ
jgi:hypothetical protein